MKSNIQELEGEVNNEKIKQKIIYLAKFILIALAYGLNGTTITSIPFLFLGNKLDCLNEKGQSYQCDLEEACSNKFGYIQIQQVDYPQIYSITMFLNIYCDRKVIEAWILTLATFGKILSGILLIIFPIPKEKKDTIINIIITMIGLNLCLLHWIQHTYMFFLAFFTWQFGFTLFYGIIYSHILEYFPDYISKYGAAIMNACWPALMVLYICYALYFGTWENTMVHFSGIPLLIIGISQIYLSSINISKQNQFKKSDDVSDLEDIEELNNKPESLTYDQFSMQNNQKEKQQDKLIISKSDINQNNYVSDLSNQNVYEVPSSFSEKYFPYLNKGTTIRKNFYIWTLGWSCNAVCYVGCYYQLNTLNGNLYFNCFLSTLFEVLASFFALIVVVKFQNKIKKIIVYTYLITGLAFISSTCLDGLDDTADFSQNQSHSQIELMNHYLIIFVKLLPIIAAKVSYEMMWTVLITYQKNIIPIEYLQTQFCFSNAFSNVVNNLVPFYKYFSEMYGVNPFLGLGIFCFITAYYSNFFEEIIQEGQQDQNKLDIQDKELTEQETKNNKDTIST